MVSGASHGSPRVCLMRRDRTGRSSVTGMIEECEEMRKEAVSITDGDGNPEHPRTGNPEVPAAFTTEILSPQV